MSGDHTGRPCERMTLYRLGLADSEIAQRLGVDRCTIWRWRKNKGLVATKPRGGIAPADRMKVDRSQVTVGQALKRRELYESGLSDPAIAAAVGIRPMNVLRWRQREGLPANLPAGRNTRANAQILPATADLHRRALALLARGIGARLIARELRASVKTLERWRSNMLRNQHDRPQPTPSRPREAQRADGRRHSSLPDALRAQALALYADGLHDDAIGRSIGVSRARVWQWRAGLNLPAWRRPGQRGPAAATVTRAKPIPPAITPRSNPLYAKLADAVGRRLAPDLTDDAISDLWVAVAEGRVSLDRLEQEAKRIRSDVFGRYANPYGDRSLDEDIGDGDGFRMVDLIRDERSSSWLEEAGATVW